MNENTQLTGQCLCKSVTMRVNQTPEHIDACHCSMCRNWAGGPLLVFEAHNVDIDGQEHVQSYDSSEWAERCFCKKCGTHLFYKLKGQNFYTLPVGFFSELDQHQGFKTQIFIDEKPAYYDFANKTQMMTGAEVFAKFGASD